MSPGTVPRQREPREPWEDRLERLVDQVSDARVTLARIDERQASRVAEDARAVATIADHEARLRGLERFRYALPATAIASLASLLATLIHH